MVEQVKEKVQELRGVYFFTSILEDKKDAVFMKRLASKVTVNEWPQTEILLVTNKYRHPIYILKSIVGQLSDKEGYRQGKKEYELAHKCGYENAGFVKGVSMQESQDLDKNLWRLELLFEYGGVDLHALMSSKKLTGFDLLKIAEQTAYAMEYAHAKSIFHSDLKPQNIVYDGHTAKIIDFGVSVDFARQSQLLRETRNLKMVGWTYCYCAPELLTYRDSDTHPIFKHDAIDVYSWAMSFYHILSQKRIDILMAEWEALRKDPADYPDFLKQVRALQLGPEIPKVASDRFIDLLLLCLDYEPQKRPPFKLIYSKVKNEINAGLVDPSKKGENPVAKSSSKSALKSKEISPKAEDAKKEKKKDAKAEAKKAEDKKAGKTQPTAADPRKHSAKTGEVPKPDKKPEATKHAARTAELKGANLPSKPSAVHHQEKVQQQEQAKDRNEDEKGSTQSSIMSLHEIVKHPLYQKIAKDTSSYIHCCKCATPALAGKDLADQDVAAIAEGLKNNVTTTRVVLGRLRVCDSAR